MECRRRDHSGLMPANFTTFAHFSVSSAINLPKSAGDPANGTSRRVGKALPHLGIGKSGVDLSIEPVDYVGGRGFGSDNPIPTVCLIARQKFAHGRDVRQNLRRLAVVTASARSAPALIWASEAGTTPNVICTSPLSRAVSAGASPR